MVSTSNTENSAHRRDVQTQMPGNLALPVRISLDGLLFVAARGNMIHGTRVFYAKRTGHAALVL
jgi:hypothetical protein